MHDRLSVNSLCFPDADFEQMIKHWRALNARRVSFVGWLLGERTAEAREPLKANGFQLETMTHLFMNGGALTKNPEPLKQEQERLLRLLDAAAIVGGKSVYLVTGGRGAMTWEDAAELFSNAVAPCLQKAKEAGVKLLIEPAAPFYADGHLVHSLRDTLTLAEMSGLGICVDIYACWMEAGLKQTLEQAMPRCHLFQVSDYVYGDRSLPSRAVPGDGDVPLKRILDWALTAGYQGAFDFELIGPRIDKEGHLNATRRAAEYTGNLLVSLGA